MRKISLSNSMGLLATTLFVAACGGGDDPEPGALEDSAIESEAPMAMPEAPAAGEAPAAPGAAPAAGGGDAAMVAMGQQVWSGQGLCFTCHGQDAQGTPLAPSLTDGQWMWIEEPGTDLQTKLVTLIRTGVAQPREYPAPMPPMGGAQLSEEQLEAVAAYVVSVAG